MHIIVSTAVTQNGLAKHLKAMPPCVYSAIESTITFDGTSCVSAFCLPNMASELWYRHGPVSLPGFLRSQPPTYLTSILLC